MPTDTSHALPRILVCDDSATMRTVVRRILEPAYEVLTTETAEEALTLAPAFGPDLIICDLWLPGMSGTDLCRRSASVPSWPTSPSSWSPAWPTRPAGPPASRPAPTTTCRSRSASGSCWPGWPRCSGCAAPTRRWRPARGELQRANEALRAAQDQLVRTGKLASVGTLAAGLAHQINNPLACIKSDAGALVDVVDEIARLARPRGRAGLGAAGRRRSPRSGSCRPSWPRRAGGWSGSPPTCG